MLLIEHARIVNEGRTFEGNVLIDGEVIKEVSEGAIEAPNAERLDATGLYLMPGMIDDQVHFREPGATHKGELYTESRAAVAGGITSFMEMPNTVPNTLTQELLQDKYDMAAEKSIANYSFYMGAGNDNLEQVLKTDPKRVCGVKVFMGSSTGNMLVDNRTTLEGLFSECPLLIATHCEDEQTIRNNSAGAREQFGEDVPIEQHPIIRSEEACYKSSSLAAELATRHNARLHILHISTAKELSIFSNDRPLEEKHITAEACIHHLWFTDAEYATRGSRIKWNPAVKRAEDRMAIRQAVNDNVIDVIATDHAPHTWEEKNNPYFKAPSGGPLVQHALIALMEMNKQGIFSLEHIVEKYAHSPARMFAIENRGYIRAGYQADLVLVNPDKPWTATDDNNLYKCQWTPFHGDTFSSSIEKTFVNGSLVYDNGSIIEGNLGQRLTFDK